MEARKRPRKTPKANCGFAPAPKRERDRQYNRIRLRVDPEHDRFYRRKAWGDLRTLKLNRSPLCERCEARGVTTAAIDVDHKIDRRTRPDLELDYDNLQSLCKTCHASKTRKGE